jgi:amino acid adenylation domain-containing protein
VVLITMHHIISDAWSMEIFIRELAALYEACVKAEDARLPELPLQYAEFAASQRRTLTGEALDTQLAYWKQQLAGALPVLDLPTDHPRPPVQTFRGARQLLRLSKETTDELKALSQSRGVTMFMTLLSAFKVLLHHYSGQEDIIVGTPIAGRNRAEIEPLIGCFLNTVVLRTDLSGNPSFTHVLDRVREVALGAYANQEVPFELLLEHLQPVRDLSRSPLFQVMFNLLNVPETQISLSDLLLEIIPTPDQGSKFDLTLYAVEQEDTLGFIFVYNPDLFEERSIAHMRERFQALLLEIARNPQQPTSMLLRQIEESLRPPARHRQLVRRDKTFVEFSRSEIEQSLPARFLQQVHRHSEKTAVKTRQHEWTYAELNRRADRVAQALLAQRGTHEERIVLLFEHDAPMIAAMLGVLKAGKTYVPLDPAYPRLRTEYILTDAQATSIVTDNRNLLLARELASSPTHVRAMDQPLAIVNLDDPGSDIASVHPEPHVSPASIAYLLYTSGSTGQPKGVMQNHRNVLHHIRTYTNALGVNPADKLLQLASYSFDASVMDIYGALLNGATLYPVNLRAEGLSELAAWLNKEKLTIYHSTPTVYRYFMATLGDEQRLESIRLVVLGGEEALRQDVVYFKSHFGAGSVLVNGLGPTESTMALQYFLNHETEVPRQGVPIGHAVADTEVRLLNQAGDEVSGYGAGEIEIRSAHLALGYWKKPEITRSAFSLDKEMPTHRQYKTGDMARRLLDGSLEYIGRKDDQVKVRGMRVELGEIEAQLLQHERILSVAVVARRTQRGEQQLVCYLTCKENEQKPTSGELLRYLKKRVPEYMVPTFYVVVDELPLTPNGKVDRRALPDIVAEQGEQREGYLGPLTAGEEIMAEVWTEVLGLERVGLNDNFFEVGGHSLLATQVISRVRETFEVEMPLRSLFENPTLGEFVVAVQEYVVRSVEELTDEEAWSLI